MIAEELKLKEKLHPPDTITRTLQPNRKNKNQINETERFNTGQVVFSLLKFFFYFFVFFCKFVACQTPTHFLL